MDAGKRTRRVRIACEPCRLRKTKCDEQYPCGKCLLANKSCYFESRRRKAYRHPPPGYVELLEVHQERLQIALMKLYEIVRNGENWPGPKLQDSNGRIPVHYILGALNLTDGYDATATQGTAQAALANPTAIAFDVNAPSGTLSDINPSPLHKTDLTVTTIQLETVDLSANKPLKKSTTIVTEIAEIPGVPEVPEVPESEYLDEEMWDDEYGSEGYDMSETMVSWLPSGSLEETFFYPQQEQELEQEHAIPRLL